MLAVADPIERMVWLWPRIIMAKNDKKNILSIAIIILW